MRVAVFGLGYVGLTACCCLTMEGHSVLGVDVSSEKVSNINAGISPISEPGVSDQVSKAVSSKELFCVSKIKDELFECDIAIVCVGTPSAADGSHNMTFIAEVSRQIAFGVNRDRTKPLVVMYRSTIRPGTVDNLITPIFTAILGDDFDKVKLVYNPEFLRESTAIADYFDPPKIVVGTRDGEICQVVEELYKAIPVEPFYTKYKEAEFTKFMDNTFHALKVSFANEIGRICLELGVQASKVHEIFISDTKLNISPYYLRPGGAFGGSCLPKDVRALQYISTDVGANTPLVDSLIRSNEAHKHFLYEHCVKGLKKGASVLLVGLAFKANTDDLRESPKVDLARKLIQAGFVVSVYDPSLIPEKLIGQNLGYLYSNISNLSELLVCENVVREKRFDLLVDTNGTGKSLGANFESFIDITSL